MAYISSDILSLQIIYETAFITAPSTTTPAVTYFQSTTSSLRASSCSLRSLSARIHRNGPDLRSETDPSTQQRRCNSHPSRREKLRRTVDLGVHCSLTSAVVSACSKLLVEQQAKALARALAGLVCIRGTGAGRHCPVLDGRTMD